MNDDLTLLASAYLDGDVTADERARVENDAEVLAEVDRLRSARALLGDVEPQVEVATTPVSVHRGDCQRTACCVPGHRRHDGGDTDSASGTDHADNHPCSAALTGTLEPVQQPCLVVGQPAHAPCSFTWTMFSSVTPR